MSTSDIITTVNGITAHYRLLELTENTGEQLMILAFELMNGDIPEFEENDTIDLAYRLYGVDWKTSHAKVIAKEDNTFKVHIEFANLMRKFLDRDDMRHNTDDLHKIITDDEPLLGEQ